MVSLEPPPPKGPDSGSGTGDPGEPEGEADRPAPAIAKLALTAAPFLALIVLFVLDRCVLGR